MYLVKMLNILASLFIFGVLINCAHEFGHYYGGLVVGIDGYIKGMFYCYPSGLTPTAYQDIVVSLSAGLGIAVIYAGLYFVRKLSEQYSKWDMDDCFALLAVGIWQGLYAFSEVINWNYGSIIAAIAGFGIALLVYGRPLLNWLKEEK